MQTAWINFLKLAINATTPFFGMAPATKSKYPAVGEATTTILKSVSGGKTLSLSDMHGNGLRLGVL